MSWIDIVVEKWDQVKFYEFTFYGIDKPVIIEACTSKAARTELQKIIDQLPEEYMGKAIVGQKVSLPVTGVSKKKKGGIELVWVGKDITADGWQKCGPQQ